MAIEKNSEHVDFKHLGLIAFTALVLIAVTFFQNGLRLFSAKAQDSSNKNVLTYDQVKAQVYAQNQADLDSALAQIDDKKDSEQIATLDPSRSGEVLGASTDGSVQTFPKAETLFTNDVLQQIKINKLNTTDLESIKKYSADILVVESEQGALKLISDLNSSDAQTIKSIKLKSEQIVKELAKIPVPSDLEEYHKLKLAYYTTIGTVAQNLTGEKTNADPDSSVTILFSLIERLQTISASIFEKYQVSI